MAPTPPSGDSMSPGAARQDEKIRRNVACISCRDSKVRCKASSVAGQPCQRCAKLRLACVYDKSHRRVSKRSKLELLEQELKTIKEAVNPRSNGESSWSPPTPRATNSLFPQQGTPASAVPPPPPLVLSTSTTFLEPSKRVPPTRFQKTGPTKPRMLEDRLIPGEDIDYYFSQFLQCFHPYVPVLRKRDPDECWEANQTLFWVVIYVASRRYARDEHILTILVEQLSRDIYPLIATPNLDLEAIHAILFICAWPFPTIRFVTDPSTVLITVAVNASMLLGLHHGKGTHPEFCVGGRLNFYSTDFEAANTWIACCTLAQRIATYSGITSPFLQHQDAHCKAIVGDTLPSELMTLFELQKFSNRLHLAMEGQVISHGGVFEATAQSWEAEFETLRPFVTRVDTDCSRFFLLVAQLEVQSYYFLAPPSGPPPSLLNALRAYTTAQAILTTSLALESTSKFLTHAPNWICRSLVDAACILVSSLHSTAAPAHVTPDAAVAVATQVRTAVQCCSVRDGDLPSRGAVILDTVWSVRNLLPRFEGTRRAWPSRLGAGVTFWCLSRFREALQVAKKSTEGVNKGLEAFQAPLQDTTEAPLVEGSQDPFQDVDWSLLMDDFGWVSNEPVFLGPPQC